MEFTRVELYMLLNLHPSDRALWLVQANLEGANLSGANLRRADLSAAKVMEEQLAQAKILEGAILPDGTMYAGESDHS